MEVKLLTDWYHFSKLANATTPLNAYIGSGVLEREIDYTGRWMIQDKDSKVTLYLECFHLYFEDKEVVEEYIVGGHSTERGFLWWKRTVNIPPERAYRKVIKPVLKARVMWIAEHDLRISTTEQFINECGADCGS